MSKKEKTSFVEPVYKELGHRLRWLREQRGLSQNVLGEAIGYNGSSLATWEHGKTRLGIAELVLLCQALKVSPVAFLDDLDPNECRATEEAQRYRKEKARERVQRIKERKGSQ